MVETAHSVQALQDGKQRAVEWSVQPGDLSYRVLIGTDDVKISVRREGEEEDTVYEIQMRQPGLYEDDEGKQFAATVLMAGSDTALASIDQSAVIIEGTGSLQLGDQVLDVQEAALIIDGHTYKEGDTVQIGDRTAVIGRTSIREP